MRIPVAVGSPSPVRLRSDELLVALRRLARLSSLRSLHGLRFLTAAVLRSLDRARAPRRRLHEALQRIGILGLISCAVEDLPRGVLLACLLVPGASGDVGRLASSRHRGRALRLSLALALLDVNLLHLVLLGDVLLRVHLLAVALLLLLDLLLELLLLLEEEHLLDLLLRQLLVDHLLLGREVVLLDLLATALNFEFLLLRLLVFIHLVLVFAVPIH